MEARFLQKSFLLVKIVSSRSFPCTILYLYCFTFAVKLHFVFFDTIIIEKLSMYSCCYVSSIFTADKCNLNITLNNSLTPLIGNSSVSHIDFNLKRFQLKKILINVSPLKLKSLSFRFISSWRRRS